MLGTEIKLELLMETYKVCLKGQYGCHSILSFDQDLPKIFKKMVRYQVFGRFFKKLMRVKLDDFLRGIFFPFW